MKIAKIILTEQSIPYNSNGSWTQRLELFLQSKYNNIDYVICGTTTSSINSKTTFVQVEQNKNLVLKKMTPNYRYQNYASKLDLLMKAYDHCIIMVIDNLKLKDAISHYIDSNNLKNKVSFLFYNCGFSYFLSQEKHKLFSNNLDEIIFLTKTAYLFNKNYYSEFIPEVTILNNPILKTEFYEVNSEKKEDLKDQHNLKGKKVYLWLSHDRPKKGLSIILNAWKTWSKTKTDVVLLIVGANSETQIKGVEFIGEVAVNKVHVYYKLADVYLFPTLWKEGFGLSLSQAICSGCFCIAANNGGVSDFFTTNDGILIDDPNIVNSWEKSLEVAYNQINSGWNNKYAGHQILNIEAWSEKFSQIFSKWEKRIKF